MKNKQTRREFGATALTAVAASTLSAPYVFAQAKKYDPGATDTEIKLGQTVPHSGPGSLYGVLGRVGEAYFQMLNEKGGINGRKVKFFTMDDAYSAPKCVEATRRLVEQEEVLALYGSLGTAPRPPYTNISTRRACRSCCSTPARRNGTIRRTSNGPWRACRCTDRSTDSRQHVVTETERQGRHPLPERRFRPRLPRAVQEGAGGCRRHRQGDHGADL